VDRVFLDANVLFSAAYKPSSRLLVLWERTDSALLTSAFAIEEARRNLALTRPESLPILDRLTAKLILVPEAETTNVLPDGLALIEKDRPILAAAAAAKATHLLTGDKDHFGSLFGETVGGVLILTPSSYLRSKGAADAPA
jgi:predicted nucleic acid-binding protein